MFESTIEELKHINEGINHKIPTMEESIKHYESIRNNSEKELEKLKFRKEQNEFAIEILKNLESGRSTNASMAQEADLSIAEATINESVERMFANSISLGD